MEHIKWIVSIMFECVICKLYSFSTMFLWLIPSPYTCFNPLKMIVTKQWHIRECIKVSRIVMHWNTVLYGGSGVPQGMQPKYPYWGSLREWIVGCLVFFFFFCKLPMLSEKKFFGFIFYFLNGFASVSKDYFFFCLTGTLPNPFLVIYNVRGRLCFFSCI